MGEVGWRHRFLADQLSVLSGWAKLVMMIQASISLTTVAVIAEGAVNIP